MSNVKKGGNKTIFEINKLNRRSTDPSNLKHNSLENKFSSSKLSKGKKSMPANIIRKQRSNKELKSESEKDKQEQEFESKEKITKKFLDKDKKRKRSKKKKKQSELKKNLLNKKLFPIHKKSSLKYDFKKKKSPSKNTKIKPIIK